MPTMRLISISRGALAVAILALQAAGSPAVVCADPGGAADNGDAPRLGAALRSVPLATRSTASGATLFTTLSPADTGLEFENPIDTSHPMEYLYASSMATGGVAVADFDGDGVPDIFLVSGPRPNALFRQTGPWRFENVARAAGVEGGDLWGVGCVAFDADGDGDTDLYVCNYLAPNQLFLNRGDGTFEEAAAAAGLDVVDASHTPTVCDYDGDGDLDLYILTNRWYRPEGFPDEQTIEVTAAGVARVLPQWERFYDAVQTGPDRYETMVVGRPDILFRNNGDGTFTDVSREAGIVHRGHGLAAIWFDWNGDHRPDLWVGNDFDDADRLYRNEGDGTFTDVTLSTVPYTTWFSMGADFGDVDGDALPDFFIADMSGTNHFKQKTAMGAMGEKYWFMANARPPQLMRNCLFVNAGNGRFLEAAYLAGVADSNWTWAVRLADLDNDGRNDLYIQAGMSRNFNEKDDPRARIQAPGKTQWDRFRHLPPLREPNWAYRNEGDLAFSDVSARWGLDHVGMSFGCALADLDRDGDLDIVSVRLDESVALLRNDAPSGRRLLVRLDAPGTANPSGIGATLTLHSSDGAQIRTLNPVRGYLGCDEPIAHFGLGEDAHVASLHVRWPDGLVQRFKDPEVDHMITVTRDTPATRTEGGGADPDTPTTGDLPTLPSPGPLFVPDEQVLAEARHQERDFDDFAREPLLPNSMSRWGPGHAWGDADGDGDLDLYLGSGKHGTRRILFREADGFRPRDANPFAGEFLFEDMGALFLDVDGDGDRDLYVVSGGVETEPGSSTLCDRLYLNDGNGSFTRAPDGILPFDTESGGPVAAADFDRDGDLDLFIGGRCIPGAYPLGARSRLLRNEGGRFVDITADLPPTLAEAGMVTAALWSDADGDGWIDLLVASEWGPIRLFRNQGGRLADATEASGLAGLTGWWNGLAGRDIDGDGDIDYVATNFGLNTKYHASSEHPALIFHGDMDGSGRRHIVEAEYEDGTVFPIRGRSCSSAAMPFIAGKFDTYRAFALASLEEIYTPETLAAVDRFEATTLASGVLRNDGAGRFAFERLPWIAQVAPAFGVALTELDGDGRPDLVLAQNFLHPQIETGVMSGGLGVVMTGNPTGSFTPLRPHESGLSVPDDARSLTLIDVNGDGREDIVVARNNQPMLAFIRTKQPEARLLAVSLDTGNPANPDAVGARVTVAVPELPPQTAEVHAGSGYLSQSPTTLVFGAGPRPADADPDAARQPPVDVAVSVRWPDGQVTSHSHRADDQRGTVSEVRIARRPVR